MEKLLIFPFSGSAIEALDCLNQNQICIGFISDNFDHINKSYNNIPIYDRSILNEFIHEKIVLLPGSPKNFLQKPGIIKQFNLNEARYTKLIHRSAQVSKNVHLGNNIIIMANCVITSNAFLGNHICILPNSTIHHDSCIDDYTIIGSNVVIAGNTKIGNNCYIGSGSTISNNLTIENEVLIGIGSNVIRNIPEYEVWVGNPAKKIK